MMQYISYLKNPIVAGLFAGLVIVIALYIDSKMNYKDFDNNTYMKAFAVVAITTGILVYYGKDVVSGGKKHRSGGSLATEVMDGLPEF